MKNKHKTKTELLPDPVGDALADVYIFLLRKLAVYELNAMTWESEPQNADTAEADHTARTYEQTTGKILRKND